ncbi:MAG: glycosyltransferase [Clostridia bacterium]|nr:glycosyltransferase [Clostridia bacterium]
MEEKDKRKIVLIGPVYPYKGGIAHYTGLLYRALAKVYDVTMVSYKFQYPKLLFKKEQKDYSNDTFKIENTNYWLHTANPFNCISTARKINKIKPDMVIIQWWHPYFAPCYYILCKCLKKTKILFICHNVFPHERFPLDKFLTKLTLKQGKCYIVQSKKDADDLKTIIKNPVFKQTVHPTYNAFKIENMSREEARKRLGIEPEKKVLLFFGFIREYKGLKYLIQAMPEIVSKIPDVELLIVGDYSGEDDKKLYTDMIKQCQIENYVKIFDGYIPDREVEKFFAACDLVVLPYISATQSGIVQIAFGFEKPVVVTNVGGLPDVVTDGKTGYVVEPQNPNAITNAIIDFYKNDKNKIYVDEIEREKNRYSWEHMENVINSFFHSERKQ